MSDNGWPDPARPGVPLNPERDGYHWGERDGGLEPRFWSSGQQLWAGVRNSWITPKMLAALFNYAGPCLTPAEVDARVSEAMKWRTAIYDALIEWHDPPHDDETPKAALRRLVHTEILAALDPAVSRLAADLVAQAQRDALEEAARRILIYFNNNHIAQNTAAAIRALKGGKDER
jgi:hypothetical protein